jgi:hypothetical protein
MANTIDQTSILRLVRLYSQALSLSTIANKVSMSAGIYLQTLTSTVNKVTMVADATGSSSLTAIINATPKLIITTTIVQINAVTGSALCTSMSLNGSAVASNQLIGNINITRFARISGSMLGEATLEGSALLKLIPSNFGLYGTAFSITQNVALSNVIVLNLRTKAHSIYREATLDAYAITGELLFGSNKNKNISDAFLFGRSNDAIELTVWNDEEKSRLYVVDYKSGTQGNLKNKKRPLSKGLYGTNWKFKVAKNGSTTAEVRSVDLFVNELKRHT